MSEKEYLENPEVGETEVKSSKTERSTEPKELETKTEETTKKGPEVEKDDTKNDLCVDETLENVDLNANDEEDVALLPSESTEKTDDKEEKEPAHEPSTEAKNTKKEESEEVPILPPRRSTSVEKTKHPLVSQLQEAFPQFEEKYITAIVIASQGNLEAGYNACLYLANPTDEEIVIPDTVVPVRRVPPAGFSGASAVGAPLDPEQIKADELLARQLNEKYNAPRSSHSRKNRPDAPATRSSRQRRPLKEYPPDSDDELHNVNNKSGDEDALSNFIEKDFPVLKENVNKSIRETSTKVGNWFKSFGSNSATTNSGSSNSVGRNSNRNIDELYYENDNDDRLFLQDTRYSNVVNQSNEQSFGFPQRGEKKRFNSFGNSDQKLNIRSSNNYDYNPNVNIQYKENSGDLEKTQYQPPPALPPRRSTTGFSEEPSVDKKSVTIDTPFNDNKKFKTPAKVQTNEFDAVDDELSISPELSMHKLQIAEPVAMIGDENTPTKSKNVFKEKQTSSSGPVKNQNDPIVGGSDIASSSKSRSISPEASNGNEDKLKAKDDKIDNVLDMDDDLDFSD